MKKFIKLFLATLCSVFVASTSVFAVTPEVLDKSIYVRTAFYEEDLRFVHDISIGNRNSNRKFNKIAVFVVSDVARQEKEEIPFDGIDRRVRVSSDDEKRHMYLMEGVSPEAEYFEKWIIHKDKMKGNAITIKYSVAEKSVNEDEYEHYIHEMSEDEFLGQGDKVKTISTKINESSYDDNEESFQFEGYKELSTNDEEPTGSQENNVDQNTEENINEEIDSHTDPSPDLGKDVVLYPDKYPKEEDIFNTEEKGVETFSYKNLYATLSVIGAVIGLGAVMIFFVKTKKD